MSGRYLLVAWLTPCRDNRSQTPQTWPYSQQEGHELCSASDLRTVKTLLWAHLSSQLKPAERGEVKHVLGRSLIEGNEELFAEAEALADILGTVQLTTATVLQRQKLCNNPNRSMVRSSPAGTHDAWLILMSPSSTRTKLKSRLSFGHAALFPLSAGRV